MVAEASAVRSLSERFTPRIRLFVERLLVRAENDRLEEVEAPVLSLRFDYPSGSTRPLAPERDDAPAASHRDLSAEAEAQRLLESFGAVELGCLPSYEPCFGSEADYVIQPDGNIHSWCSFSAHAIPELERLGWSVELGSSYPFQVLNPGTRLYASVEEAPDRDWFNLELGVEVDGRRVSLVPALVELIDQHPGASSLQALLRLPVRYRAVRAGPNLYLPIPAERLERVLKVLLELYRGERVVHPALELNRSQAASLVSLDRALGTDGGPRLAWHGDSKIRSRAESLAAPPDRTGESPPNGLVATLRSYQTEGLGWMQHLRAHDVGGVLADDMGLGKTLQTIAHICLEKQSGRLDRASLIVVPTSLVSNWERELRRFAPGLEVAVLHGPKRHANWRKLGRADVVITTYSIVTRDIERFKKAAYHLLILDEAQAIKNPRSLAKRAVGAIDARHRLCLTGTPVENNLSEIWSLFDFLMPGFLGSAQSFQSRFARPLAVGGRPELMDALRARVSPFILRRTKEQVARELPPKTELVCPVELCGDQRDLYESIRVAAHRDVRRAIRKHGISASSIAILDALMKLRQVCCDPRLVAVRSAQRVRRSVKLERLLELLDAQLSEGRRILVFSQFTQMLELIRLSLEERKIGYVELTGATQDRRRAVDRFQSSQAEVFLISLKAGGTGLNLTRADTVIHYDPWWNAAAKCQATDRAHRIGQKNPVFVHNLIVAGSVEERMLALQRRKQHLADALLGGISTRSAAFSVDEIEDLFAPLSD